LEPAGNFPINLFNLWLSNSNALNVVFRVLNGCCFSKIENLPHDITAVQLLEESASFGVVVSTYIPNKVAKSGRKFRFARFQSRVDRESAIHSTHRIVLQDNLVSVYWESSKR